MEAIDCDFGVADAILLGMPSVRIGKKGQIVRRKRDAELALEREDSLSRGWRAANFAAAQIHFDLLQIPHRLRLRRGGAPAGLAQPTYPPKPSGWKASQKIDPG